MKRALPIAILFAAAAARAELSVTVGDAVLVTRTSATLAVTCVDTGVVSIVWGTNSGGTNVSAWAHTNAFGELGDETAMTNITGLSAGTVHYYAAYATNATVTNWSAIASWSTLPASTTGSVAKAWMRGDSVTGAVDEVARAMAGSTAAVVSVTCDDATTTNRGSASYPVITLSDSASGTLARAAAAIGSDGSVTGSLLRVGAAIITEDYTGIAPVIYGSESNRPVCLLQGTNFYDATKGTVVISDTDIDIYMPTGGSFDVQETDGTHRFMWMGTYWSFWNTTISNVVVRGTISAFPDLAASLALPYTVITNPPWLTTASSLDYGKLTNSPSTLARYAARSTSGSEVYVTATSTGITATLSGSTATFTIPSGVIPLSAQIRVPAGSGTTLTLAVGTNWYPNTGWSDRWGFSAAVYREDTGAQVTSASTKLSPSTFTEGQVLGLVDTVVSRVCVEFQ
jgi:hypothetical protein